MLGGARPDDDPWPWAIRQNLGPVPGHRPPRELGIAVSDFPRSAISVQQVAWGLSQPFAGILGRPARHAPGVALGGSVLFIAGLWLTATAQGALPIVIGAGRADRQLALACTTSGNHRQPSPPPSVPADPPDASPSGIVLRGRLGRHHAGPRRSPPYLLNHEQLGALAVWGFFAISGDRPCCRPPGSAASRARPSCPNGPADPTASLTLRGRPSTKGAPPSGPTSVMAMGLLRSAGLQARLPHHPPADLPSPSCGMDASYSAIVLMLIGGFQRREFPGCSAGWANRYPQAPAAGRESTCCGSLLPGALHSCPPPTPLSVVLFGRRQWARLWAGVSSRWSTGWSCSLLRPAAFLSNPGPASPS